MYALTTNQLQVERREREIEPVKCMSSPHTSYRWRGERVIETIKCMRSPHTSYRWRGEESHRANQVYALTAHQLQVERRERQSESSVRSHHTPATSGEERETKKKKTFTFSKSSSFSLFSLLPLLACTYLNNA